MLAPPTRKIWVRAAGDAAPLWKEIRQAIQEVDRNQRILHPAVREQSLAAELDQAEFDMALFGGIAALGLLLTVAGIYGVLAYRLNSISHEIALRAALGAERNRLLATMFAFGGRLVLIGLACGILGAILLTHNLASTTPVTDAIAVGLVVVSISLPAFAACYLPARRAVLVSPASALRHE
jgi:putative ABC transport system permease protein